MRILLRKALKKILRKTARSRRGCMDKFMGKYKMLLDKKQDLKTSTEVLKSRLEQNDKRLKELVEKAKKEFNVSSLAELKKLLAEFEDKVKNQLEALEDLIPKEDKE